MIPTLRERRLSCAFRVGPILVRQGPRARFFLIPDKSIDNHIRPEYCARVLPSRNVAPTTLIRMPIQHRRSNSSGRACVTRCMRVLASNRSPFSSTPEYGAYVRGRPSRARLRCERRRREHGRKILIIMKTSRILFYTDARAFELGLSMFGASDLKKVH